MEIPDYLVRSIARHYRTLAEETPDTQRGHVRIHNARRQAKGEIRRLEKLIESNNGDKGLQEKRQGADTLRRWNDDG